jgi:ABC-2 type transport system permease protein
MINILTLAKKELKAYFFSPIAYVVIGFFVFIFGYFFTANLVAFQRFSMQAGMFGGGGQVLNVNEHMIRPVLMNAGLILVFVLPFITMRSYAEEKKSGTMELLLSSPLTDLQIVLGKFLGAMALFGLMLAVTFIHVGLLFIYGEPELLPVLSSYLGLFLMGGSFISLGLLISSMTKSQILAGFSTVVILLLLWTISWMADPTGGSTISQFLSYLSFPEHYNDFSRGIIDTKHLAYYLSFIIFGLFLTVRVVDTERWRG